MIKVHSAPSALHTHRAFVPPVLARLAGLSFRFLTFAILGLAPWWLAVEVLYAR